MPKKSSSAPDRISQIIGHNLKILRQGAGLSQPQLGHLLGVTFQQVQKYEKGTNRLPIAHMHFLKCYMNVPYDFFFDGLDKPAVIHKGFNIFRLKSRIDKVKDPSLLNKIERVVEVLAE